MFPLPFKDYRLRNIAWPPSLLIRQFGSVLLFKHLVGWKHFVPWLVRHSLPSFPVAAGAVGMGCIGYPAHPVFEVTNTCNLRCIHCHASSGKPDPNELTTAEAKRVIDGVAATREFRMLVFTGGEPLIRPDIFDLLTYSKKQGLINVVATNGTMIDEPMARDLRKAGVVGAAISLDSASPTIHNQIRRHETAFDLALRGMRAVRKAGILLQVNVTAMEYNFDHLEELIALIEANGSGIILMYQLVPVGRGSGIETAALNVGDNEKLLRFLSRVQGTLSSIVEPVAGPQYWPFLLEKRGKTSPSWIRRAETVFFGCAAGRGFVYIKANGEVWPCPFVEVSAGNIREKRFTDIYPGAELFQRLRKREFLLKGKCGECNYRKMCGGCRGRALACTGDLFAEDPSCFLR
ncbi:MAG: radical SAM protein [Candidatus Omnitrophota bacterium]